MEVTPAETSVLGETSNAKETATLTTPVLPKGTTGVSENNTNKPVCYDSATDTSQGSKELPDKTDTESETKNQTAECTGTSSSSLTMKEEVEEELKKLSKEKETYKKENGNKVLNILSYLGSYIQEANTAGDWNATTQEINHEAALAVREEAAQNINTINDYTSQIEQSSLYAWGHFY